MKTTQIVMLPMSKVFPDPHQPRQYFDAAKLATLANSIKRIGIKEPVSVEKLPDGTYKLIDGERRYRASKILKLAEIPAIVAAPMTPSERLVQQFHVQEQHEGWRPQEKAIAIRDIANTLKMPLKEMGAMLGIPPFTMRDYIAFVELLGQNEMEKTDTPISYANAINVLTKYAVRQLMVQNEEDFTQAEQKEFQVSIIRRIASGEITNAAQLTKVRDSITQEAKSAIDSIIKKDKTVDKIFAESNARGARIYRQFENQLNALNRKVFEFTREKGLTGILAEDSATKSHLKNLIKNLQSLNV